jgi:large subunit ribosomal protein L19
MKPALMEYVEKKHQRPTPLEFEIGDTVVVTLRIVEGGKERLQDFEGAVIARRGAGLDEMFTVRRIVSDEGVERIFPLHSPRIVAIKTKRSGKVRRCKLYYLRDRVGKARRLKARHVSAAQKKAAAETRSRKLQREAEAAESAARSDERPAAEMAGAPS